MKGMSPDELAALNPKKPTGSTAAEYYINRAGERISLHGRKAEITRFEGRAGTVRRSSKGRTYRLANGTRKYMVDQLEPDEMVVYFVKPS